MTYRGFEIKIEKSHVVVIDPYGNEWREDTIEDAHKAIDEILDEN